MSKCPIEKISVINEPFEQWAESTGENITNLYINNNKIFKDILIVVYDRITVAVNLKHNRIGIARCHKNDIKKQAIGVTIAFYRMMCWELPKVQRVVKKHISELRRGDKMFDFLGLMYNRPTLEFADVYRGHMIVWDIEKHGFRTFVPKDGTVYKVLEED
ncbi:MAG: hypothetical protein ACI4JM_04745 [Oscillospiraceae bacterium]